MKIINKTKNEDSSLEVGDIICFRRRGKLNYRLVCSADKEYFTIDLECRVGQNSKTSLSELWNSYASYFYEDLHIIKSDRIKLIIE